MQGGALERIDEEVAVKPNPGPGGVARAVLTLVAAGLAAVNVVLLARIAEPRIGLAAAIALGGLALAGALALVAWATGFLHSGRPGTQRAFFDAVADAIDDPIVVTDQRGRAIYANKAFRSLAEASGHSRLIGVENLYAGFPDAADKIYRLAQAARDGRAAEEKLRLAPGSGAPCRGRAGRRGLPPR